MNELVSKVLREGMAFTYEGTDVKEIGFFLYKNYIVSVFRLLPIVDNNDVSEGSFENIYIIYDVNTDKVFNEHSTDDKKIFEELPEIDNALFNCSFEDSEEVEKYRRIVKDEVLNYFTKREVTDKYVQALERIYELIDVSSKSFYEFFINEAKK